MNMTHYIIEWDTVNSDNEVVNRMASAWYPRKESPREKLASLLNLAELDGCDTGNIVNVWSQIVELCDNGCNELYYTRSEDIREIFTDPETKKIKFRTIGILTIKKCFRCGHLVHSSEKVPV